MTGTLTRPTASTAARTRRRTAPAAAETVICDHCRGDMQVPLDSAYLISARIRLAPGDPLPTHRPCPTCRNQAGNSVGVRRRADVHTAPYIPDYVPTHWSETDRSTDDETTAAAAQQPSKTTAEHVAALRALIAAHRTASTR